MNEHPPLKEYKIGTIVIDSVVKDVEAIYIGRYEDQHAFATPKENNVGATLSFFEGGSYHSRYMWLKENAMPYHDTHNFFFRFEGNFILAPTELTKEEIFYKLNNDIL